MLLIFCVLLLFSLNTINGQLPCMEPPVNPNGTLGINYIGHQSTSDKGPCAMWSTAIGNINYKHPSQFPDNTVEDAKNYCRNPISPIKAYEPKPWCWLQQDPSKFEYCTIPSCSNICRETHLGETFKGTVSTTINNRKCQSWSSQAPHKHEYTQTNWPTGETIKQAGNNCRNPNKSPVGLWCYTTDTATIWEPCMAPLCKSTMECANGTIPFSYKSVTANDQYLQSCSPWRDIPLTHYNFSTEMPQFTPNSSNVIPIYHPALLPDDNFISSNNFCRNPDNDTAGAWCYVKENGFFRKKYCKTPCTGIWACLYDRVGQYYQGLVNVTETGKPCIAWSTHSSKYNPIDFPEKSIPNAMNYCRNPTNDKGGPWCWIDSCNFGYCTIPICQKAIIEPLTSNPNKSLCQLTNTGSEYTGDIKITTANQNCQRWDATSPNDNPYFNRSQLFNAATMAEVENFCRNPNNDARGPWCYAITVTGTAGGIGYCNIPKCFTTPNPVIIRNNCRMTLAGAEYTGTINTASDGTPCLPWSSVNNNPYKDFPDGSVFNAFNYCRNPQGSPREGPFCFVSRSGTAMQEDCVVPMCNTSLCRTSVEGYNYLGKQSVSKSLKPCLPWINISISQIRPVYFPDNSLKDANNYCRNPEKMNLYDGPFCFTSAGPETCGINYCQAQCRNTLTGREYSGIVNRASNKECFRWDVGTNIQFRNPTDLNARTLSEASNYCRNPKNDPSGPWCYTSPGTVEYCKLPVCSPSQNCYTQNNSWAYTGTVSVTSSGQECMAWKDYSQDGPYKETAPFLNPNLLPDASISEAQNYCRAPANQSSFNSRPWCYLKSPSFEPNTTIFGYCNVTTCVSTAVMPTTRSTKRSTKRSTTDSTTYCRKSTVCYTSANVSTYNGFANVTSDGTPCLPWASLKMEELSMLSGPAFSMSLLVDRSINESRNYCRIPTKEAAYVNQPWCYVSPTSALSRATRQNFGFCNISFCPTGPTYLTLEKLSVWFVYKRWKISHEIKTILRRLNPF